MKSGQRIEDRLIGPGDNDYGRSENQDNWKFDYEQIKKEINDTPRRIRLDLIVPAELAIYNAVQEIEKLGADVRLTNAEVLLQQAKDLVSDYIDEQLTTKQNG